MHSNRLNLLRCHHQLNYIDLAPLLQLPADQLFIRSFHQDPTFLSISAVDDHQLNLSLCGNRFDFDAVIARHTKSIDLIDNSGSSCIDLTAFDQLEHLILSLSSSSTASHILTSHPLRQFQLIANSNDNLVEIPESLNYQISMRYLPLISPKCQSLSLHGSGVLDLDHLPQLYELHIHSPISVNSSELRQLTRIHLERDCDFSPSVSCVTLHLSPHCSSMIICRHLIVESKNFELPDHVEHVDINLAFEPVDVADKLLNLSHLKSVALRFRTSQLVYLNQILRQLPQHLPVTLKTSFNDVLAYLFDCDIESDSALSSTAGHLVDSFAPFAGLSDQISLFNDSLTIELARRKLRELFDLVVQRGADADATDRNGRKARDLL